MSSEAILVIPAVAATGLIGFMFFAEKIVVPVIIGLLAELGMKSSTAGQRPNPIIESITGYAAQLKPVPPKKRSWLWRLRHWRH
ncbi:MAG: hypothetical protein WC246_01235 [Candidatus Paceibacterota bacterium]